MPLPYANATSGAKAVTDVHNILRGFGCSKLGHMPDFDAGRLLVQFEKHGRPVSPNAGISGYAASSHFPQLAYGRVLRLSEKGDESRPTSLRLDEIKASVGSKIPVIGDDGQAIECGGWPGLQSSQTGINVSQVERFRGCIELAKLLSEPLACNCFLHRSYEAFQNCDDRDRYPGRRRHRRNTSQSAGDRARARQQASSAKDDVDATIQSTGKRCNLNAVAQVEAGLVVAPLILTACCHAVLIFLAEGLADCEMEGPCSFVRNPSACCLPLLLIVSVSYQTCMSGG